MTRDLELRPINDLLGESFAIPSYQRGYRWTERQVRELLDDLHEFERTRNERPKESFYCLQPVVVMPREEGEWEVIDGQQRLTTLLLVLNTLANWVQALGKKAFSLQYDTRPGSAAFLAAPDEARHQDNIDYFHLFRAQRSIQEWFAEHDGTVQIDLLNCLLAPTERNVQVIWYELPEGTNPIDVFVRLNVGKIRLTNAELIRALFLRAANFVDDAEGVQEDRLAHAYQFQIAQEWDAIEKRLQDDRFWYFIHSGPSPWPARIEYLFRIRVEELGLPLAEHDEYSTFLAYQTLFPGGAEARQRWREIRQLAQRLDEWADDRVLYHLVGFIISVEDRPGAAIVVELMKQRAKLNRTAFERYLRGRIFANFLAGRADTTDLDDMEASDVAEQVRGRLEDLSYSRSAKEAKARLRSTLLLFNVATLLRNGGSNLRFPFDLFEKEKWDIEHIRSVKSQMPGRVEGQKSWLKDMADYWKGELEAERQQRESGARPARDEDTEEQALRPAVTGGEGATSERRVAPSASPESSARDQLISKVRALRTDFDQIAFVELYERILKHFGEAVSSEEEHGIDNLALLDRSTNRGYKNAVFPVKRRYVLELDKTGTFVPLCTTNVFLKYYSSSIEQMMFWRSDDARAYLEAMAEMLTHFFSEAGR